MIPLLVLLLLAAAGCSAGHADLAEPAPVRPRQGDLTVHRGSFEDRFLLTGQLLAGNADSLVVPRTPNWQTTIRWLEAEGSVVKAEARVGVAVLGIWMTTSKSAAAGRAASGSLSPGPGRWS